MIALLEPPFLARPARLVALVLLLALSAGAWQTALADCAELRSRVEAARAAEDVPALRALFDQAALNPACDDAYRAWLGQTVVRGIARTVQAAVAAGRPLAAFEADLADSLRYGRHWQVLAWLGDILAGRGAHAEASLRYQESLTVIADETLTPRAPEPDVIERVFRQAELARLMADRHVPAPTTRSGSPAGLAAASIRGFVPTRVAVPVEFHFDSTDFTGRGAAAAHDLLEQLRGQGEPPITLVGHTDPTGDPDYNIRLSQRRAEAVRAFLIRSGYRGSIATMGLGATAPLQLDDPGRYSTAQIHQALRRVEVQR